MLSLATVPKAVLVPNDVPPLGIANIAARILKGSVTHTPIATLGLNP